MSLEHQNQSQLTGEEDKYPFDELEKAEEKKNFYNWQINNFYNVEKYYTAHDIIGTKGLVKAQNEELDAKKIKFRYENELYLRKHPELNDLVSCFLFKVLEEKPDNILAYAGNFFDQSQLKEIIEIEKKHYIDDS